MYLQKVISKKTFFLNKFFVGILKVNDENRRFPDPHPHPDPDPLVKRHGSADPDPDPHQNVMDPQNCQLHFLTYHPVGTENSVTGSPFAVPVRPVRTCKGKMLLHSERSCVVCYLKYNSRATSEGLNRRVWKSDGTGSTDGTYSP
jgi:hypothetical protein